jgi:serine/threonine protein kinase
VKIAHDSIVDRFWQDGEPRQPLASWYAQGRSDGIGDRLLMFDNTSAASLELLRFRPEFAAAPGFESALRERVARLAHFRHPSFAKVRAVEYLDDGEGLALVSTHTPGKRLSDVFQSHKQRAGLSPAFGIWLIKQLTPALAALQEHGEGMSHGALAPERIVLSPDGRWMVVEHVLGSAVERLQLPASRLWSDFGIVTAAIEGDSPSLDSRSDVIQLALIALSVMLGRRVTLEDYPQRLEQLLDEFTANAGRRSPALVSPLRGWLERALQLHDHVFESAGAAEEGLAELPDERGPQAVDEYRGPVLRLPSQTDFVNAGNPDLERPGSPFGPRPALSAVRRPAVSVEAPSSRPSPDPASLAVAAESGHAGVVDLSRSGTLESHSVAGTTDLIHPFDQNESEELARLLRADILRAGAPESRDTRATRETPEAREPRLERPAREVQETRGARESQVTDGDHLTRDTEEISATEDPTETGQSRVVSYQFSSAPSTAASGSKPWDRRDLSRPLVEPDQALGSVAVREIQRINDGANKKLVAAFVLVVLVAIGEAIFIGRLRTPSTAASSQPIQVPVVVESPDPGAVVVVDGRQVGVTPIQIKVGADTRSLRVMTQSMMFGDPTGDNVGNDSNQGGGVKPEGRPSDVSSARGKSDAKPPISQAAAAIPAKSAGFRLLSPLDIQVIEGDRVLGSSGDGAIVATAGRHELELVNSVVGYHTNRTVDLKGGQVQSLSLTLPDGRVSINAVPWAQVWIDGNPAGETPLANLSVPLGEHEFTFRHPQLGELHQTAVVRASGLTRVSVTFTK